MTNNIIIQFQKYCQEHGLTHADAANLIGCSRSHITRIFSGLRKPSVNLLDKMEEVMNHGK